MKALILAAGFGTRLEAGLKTYNGIDKSEISEWITGKPKGLVLIHGKPIVDYQLHQMINAGIKREAIFVQTNAVYYRQYAQWAVSHKIPEENVFNNGVYAISGMLGPLGDLKYALERRIGYDDDVLVMASDTLVFGSDDKMFDLNRFVNGYGNIGRILVYEEEKSKLSQHGIVQIGFDGAIIGFEEKPSHPKSNLVNASVHVYTSSMLQAMKDSLKEGENWGKIIEFLYPLFTIMVEKVRKRVDIGTIEDVIKENRKKKVL